MGEADLEMFFNEFNISGIKERVVPTIDLPKSEPYNDVKNKVISDETKGKIEANVRYEK